MSARRLFMVAGVALRLAAPSAACAAPDAQYRPDLPPVLLPETVVPTLEERFRDVYARAGRPRVVVYWNRELDDELVDRKTRSVELSGAAIEAGPVSAGAVRLDAAEHVVNAARGGALPRWLAAVETAFVQHLARQNVEIVDRAAIVRFESARARKGDATAQGALDTRINEVNAIGALADLLIEVTVLKAGRSPDDVEFKLLAKHTRTGAMPFALTTRATMVASVRGGFSAPEIFAERAAARGPDEFVAGPAGFAREARSMHDVGRQLATDLMAAWSETQPMKPSR